MVALFLFAAVREANYDGLTVAAIGITVYVASDLGTQYAVLEPGAAWPWPGAAVACLAWPLAAHGMVRIRARPAPLADRDRPVAEQRRTLATASLNLGLFAAFLLTVARDPRLDLVSVALPGSAWPASPCGRSCSSDRTRPC